MKLSRVFRYGVTRFSGPTFFHHAIFFIKQRIMIDEYFKTSELLTFFVVKRVVLIEISVISNAKSHKLK